jgi:hypothetical protein
MATPHVSGACGLLWSFNPAMTGQEVKSILLDTVDPTLSGLCVSGGRLNLYKAICQVKVPWISVEPEQGVVGPGAAIDVNVTFDALELTPGIYHAELLVMSEDPCSPVIVPVKVTVSADALQVSPAGSFDSTGGKGGPFEPACKKYTLTNISGLPVNWTTLQTEDWLTVIPPAGVLEPSASVDVNVCINANANLLDPNIYTDVVTFENIDSGSIKPRSVVLTVNPPDLFTQAIAAGGQFNGLSLTFRPNGSVACYEACRDEINEFPTDPNSGTNLPLGDDDFAEVVLGGGKEVLFYGHGYDRFYVGSNGYITFGAGDTEYQGSLENHFRLPRISGCFTDLTPATSQNISYRQMNDRVVVTFNDVPIYGDKTKKNSFQVEMFFINGLIRVTWLEIAADSGIAGLSEGKGLPPELFEESDFSKYPICWPLGDYDKNYVVDLADLGIFVSFWLNDDCGYPLWCDGTDLDLSSDVEGVDFSIFAENWGVTKSTMPSPIAYWKFDEGEGTIAYDSAGDNDGELKNGPTWTTGRIGGALSFDGVNDYVYVPDSAGLDVTDVFTFAFWIYDEGAPIETIISKDGSTDTTGAYNFAVLPDKSMNYETNGELPDLSSPANSILLGVWHHVAFTFAGAESPNMRIYIDGVEKASGSTPAPSILSTYLMIGRRGLSSDPRYFKGKLDEVRIYNRTLSAEDVWQLYREGQSKKASNPEPADGEPGVDPNAVLSWSPGKDALTHDVYFGTDFDEVNDADIYDPDIYMGNRDVNYWDVNSYDSNGLEPDTMFYWRIDEVSAAGTTKGDVWAFRTMPVAEVNLVSWWRFDEGTGTIAHDSAGDNDGNLINGPTWTIGQINGALSFDGVNDYVYVPDSDGLDVSAVFTFAFWMYLNEGTVSIGNIISKDGSTDTTGAYDVAVLPDKSIEYEVNNEFPYLNSGANSISQGAWHHVALTFAESASPRMRIYIDGVEKASGSPPAPSILSTYLMIGRRGLSSGSRYFGGKLDDVRIYNRALSGGEVWQLYQSGL